MQLAILSDTHDNIWKLDTALILMADADVLIHCGDLCAPFVVKRLGEQAKGRPVHIVLGNNDGDVRLTQEIARPLAASGSYDLVCYGHDHTAYQERTENTVLLNPGELMGLNGKTTFATFDTQSKKVFFVEAQQSHLCLFESFCNRLTDDITAHTLSVGLGDQLPINAS